MKPRHHPTADVLADYAAGLLAPGFGLVTGAHVEHCSVCRARVRGLEAHSGAALEELGPSEIAPAAFAAVMSRLEATPTPAVSEDHRPLLERLILKPRKWVAPGVWTAPVDTPHADNDRVYVLCLAPGAPTARHAHSGAEYCTVLSGAYRDELGVFRAGDFAAAEGGFEHKPVVEGEEACVCLFATEGRLKPKGVLGSLAFRMAGV